MSDSGGSEKAREFGPVQYIAPFLLLIIGEPGVRKVSASDRPVLFWVCATIAVLGVISTVVRLRRMGNAHRRQALTEPAWTRFLGLLLGLYALYVVYCVINGVAG